MSAETVTTKIEEKANEAAKEILLQAEKEAAKNCEEIILEARGREEKIIKTAQQNAEIIKKGIIQSAKLNSKLLILGAKRAAMNEVKEGALKEILAFSDKELLDFFVKEIKLSDLKGEFVLYPAKCHRAFVSANADKLEKDTDIKITVSDLDAEVETGFVLSSDTYDVDLSVDAILTEAFEKNEKAIYDTLFEGEK